MSKENKEIRRVITFENFEAIKMKENNQENLNKIIKDVVSEPNNMADLGIFTKVLNDYVFILVRPEKSLYEIWTRKRLIEMKETIEKVLKEKPKKKWDSFKF